MTGVSKLAISFFGDDTFQHYVHRNMGSIKASGVELMDIKDDMAKGVGGQNIDLVVCTGIGFSQENPGLGLEGNSMNLISTFS